MPHSIVVIDDEMELAVLFKQFLQGCGFDVTSFTDSKLAYEHIAIDIEKYSLIITDLRMPRMNGIELANKIRGQNDKIKIFLITAFDVSDLEKQDNFKSAKINRVIQKPIKFSILRKFINQILTTDTS